MSLNLKDPTKIAVASFKFENVLQDVSKSIQKGGTFASTGIPLSSKAQNGAQVVNRVNTVFSPERIPPSESIFSPTFNPSLAEKKSGQGLKFSFDDDNLVTKRKIDESTTVGFPAKKRTVLQPSRKPRSPRQQIESEVRSKRIKLKRSTSTKVNEDMPEPKKVRSYTVTKQVQMTPLSMYCLCFCF